MNLLEDFELNLLARATGQFGVGLVLLFMPFMFGVVFIIASQIQNATIGTPFYVLTGGWFFFMFGAMHGNANAIRKNANIKEGEAFKDAA